MLIATVKFDSREESFAWILNYLSCHPISRTALQFAVVSEVSRPLESRRAGPMHIAAPQQDGWTLGEQLEWLPKAYFLPADGTHFFWFGYQLLQVTISSTGGGGNGYPMYTQKAISVSALLSRRVLENLIKEAQRLWVEVEKGRTSVYVADNGLQWRGIVSRRSRPIRSLSTVVLDEGVKQTIVSDVTEFLRSEKWYAERGIPYRSLFYGSPGSGKTSFITALAGHFRLNVYIINLSSSNLSDDGLVRLLSMTPARCILLLEDIDSAFGRRDGDDGDEEESATAAQGPGALQGMVAGGRGFRAGMGGIPLAGGRPNALTFTFHLKNAIDGVAAQEGRILCTTTNHIEMLDPALIRPGRVDVRMYFDKASRWQARELFLNFYSTTTVEGERSVTAQLSELAAAGPASINGGGVAPTSQSASTTTPSPIGLSRSPSAVVKAEAIQAKASLDSLANKFSTSVPDRRFSMAELQLFLMKHKEDPGAAVDGLDNLLVETEKAEKAEAVKQMEKEAKKKAKAKAAEAKKDEAAAAAAGEKGVLPDQLAAFLKTFEAAKEKGIGVGLGSTAEVKDALPVTKKIEDMETKVAEAAETARTANGHAQEAVEETKI
ncbi:hypothetical protein HDU93_007674 [Gonapodya sp. JEL0774]|nr:hypothetical protein HDU93_007674 [Gonapodya sp. JEL0774]